MAALKQIFTANLITAIPVSDRLRLKILKPHPLQADPTTSAPYLTYAPAYEIGRQKSDRDLVEIGGGVLWSTPFRATCGTPRDTTQDAAYADIEELAQRVENVILANYNLSGILVSGQDLKSDDGSANVQANSPDEVWLGTRTRIYGGESEWYGEALMHFAYNFYRNRNW